MYRGAINLGNPVSSSPLNRGLVGWWIALPQRMGGNRLLDLCQPGNHGTLTNGPTWSSAAGRPGGFGSLSYTAASSQYANVGTPTAGLSAVSCGCWFNPVAIGFTQYTFFSSLDFGGIGEGLRFDLNGAASAKVQFFKYIAFGGGGATADNAAVAGEWQHALGTVDSAGVVTLYINGVAQATTGSKSGTMGSSTGYIGRAITGGVYMNGKIDDVCIWNRCLSASEVMAVVNDSRLCYPTRLNRLPMRAYGTAGGGGGGFQSAWASGSNVMIQPWVAV